MHREVKAQKNAKTGCHWLQKKIANIACVETYRMPCSCCARMCSHVCFSWRHAAVMFGFRLPNYVRARHRILLRGVFGILVRNMRPRRKSAILANLEGSRMPGTFYICVCWLMCLESRGLFQCVRVCAAHWQICRIRTVWTAKIDCIPDDSDSTLLQVRHWLYVPCLDSNRP